MFFVTTRRNLKPPSSQIGRIENRHIAWQASNDQRFDRTIARNIDIKYFDEIAQRLLASSVDGAHSIAGGNFLRCEL